MKCKKIFIVMFFLIAVSLLGGCGNKVVKINKAVMSLAEGQDITQEELDSLFEDYESLSEKEKEKINNYQYLLKYKNVNIDTIRKLQADVDNFAGSADDQKLMDIKNRYNALNDNEKNLIDLTSIQDKMDSLEEKLYNESVKAYENGKFQDAYEYFADSEYKESKEYLEKTVEGYTDFLIKSNSLDEADKYLSLVSNKEVKQKLEKELAYAHGIEYYEEGEFVEAIKAFRELADYQESEKYLERAELMYWLRGDWVICEYPQMGDKFGEMKLEGWEATVFEISEEGALEERETGLLTLNDDDTMLFSAADIEYKMSYSEASSSFKIEVIKDSYFEQMDRKRVFATKSKYFHDEYAEEEPEQAPAPAIGMTAEEVRASSWGEPYKINKTTYAWGTTEQWCYSDNRYIYFENGSVTAISE